MTSEQEKRFPLIKGGKQDEKRTLVVFEKQGPLETNQEFAQRVWQAYQQKMNTPKAVTKSSAWSRAKSRLHAAMSRLRKTLLRLYGEIPR
jgi:hypothetical protein